MKKLLLTLTLLLTLGFAASAETLSENFKTATWLTATSLSTTAATETSTVTGIKYTYLNTYRNSTYGIILKGAATNSGYISFALPGNASEITIKSGSGCSANAAVDVLAGETVIYSNLKLSEQSTEYTVEVPSANQAEGTIYKIIAVKSTEDTKYRNVQIESLTYTIEEGDPSDTREVFSFEGFKNYTMPVQDVVAYTLPEHKPAITFESSDATIAEADADGIYAYAAGSATITASWEGDATFKPGSAEFTVKVMEPAANIAAMETMAPNDGDEVYVNCPLTVVFASGTNVYVVDETGDATYLYATGDYKIGDVVPAGWVATYKLYYGLPEWTGKSPVATETAAVAYDVVESVSKADINRVVIIKDVTFTEGAPEYTTGTKLNFPGTFLNGDEVNFRTNWAVTSAEAGTYDVLCAVGFYEKDDEATLQLYPIEYTTPEIVDNEVLVEVIHDRKSGMVSVEYMFEVANHYGREVTVTANIEGFDVEFIVPENEPSNAPAHVASENKTVEGRLVAQHDDLKGVHDDLTVNLTATLDNGTVLHSNAYAIDKTTGIENVVIDGNEAAEYFNLQGVRVAEPQAGRIYIVRRGAKATKELVK